MNKTLSAVASKALISLYTFVLSAVFLSSTVAAQGAGNSDALSLLLDQNQNLQTEVQALRAFIEEQGFELRKMQRDALSRYTDVDNRLSSLEAGALNAAAAPPALTAPASGSSNATPQSAVPRTPIASGNSNTSSAAPNASTPANSSSISSSRGSSRATLQPAVLSEQQLYQMAYDSVINSNFERSIAEFDQYLSIYSDGRFVTNAHYWKGQAYLYLDRFDEAREAYELIMNQAEPSPKLPDAMYGLSLAYEGLGNIAQARQLLNEIKQRFPNTGVANLADTRLLSLD